MAKLTSNINFLQSNHFKIIIDRKQYANIEFFAQSINHPGVVFTSPAMAYKRIASVGLPGDTLTLDEIQFQIIVDEEMNSYIEMYDWIKLLTEDRSNLKGTGARRDVVSHEADISLMILNSNNQLIKTIKYVDCVPTGIGSMQFQSTTGEPAMVTFDASFRTEYFIIT
jgi:hypothetical protein